MTTPIEDLGVPASEFNEDFIQGMRQRMAVSYYKYGFMKDGCAVTDMLASMQVRLDKYAEDGNTEWLMDAANCIMMEFTHPRHPEAHYRPTDSHESPGRVHASTGSRSTKPNKDIR